MKKIFIENLSGWQLILFKLRWTLLLAIVFILFFGQPTFFILFILIFILPIFIWTLYSFAIIFTSPERRLIQFFRVVILILVCTTISFMQLYWKNLATEKGQYWANIIEEYIAIHGNCPSPEAIGWNRDKFPREVGYPLYYCEQEKVMLLYKSTMNPFDIYSYDFNTKTWKFRPD